MKRLALYLILSYLPLAVFSQEIDTALAKVFYILRHKQDLPKKDSIYVENMVLLIGKKTSTFKSYDRFLQANEVAKNLDEQSKNWTGSGLPRTKMPTNLKRYSNQEVFQSFRNKTLTTSEYLWLVYQYDEPLAQLTWKLIPERKKINDIDCQKATTKYRGREWTAWFAPDIPFETGPWKLYGLPGLILEAHDNNNEVQFLFDGLENLSLKENIALITSPLKAIKTTFSDFNKLKERMYMDPSGFAKAQTQMARGIIDSRDFAGFNSKRITNPMDLTEAK